MWGQKTTVAIIIFGLALFPMPFALEDGYDDHTSVSRDQYSCASKETCSSCIQTKGCAWCSKPDRNDSSSKTDRCRPYSDLNNLERKSNESGGREERSAESESWCPTNYIVMPVTKGEIIKDVPLQRASKTEESHTLNAVQIRPQKVKLKLRVNETYSLRLQYAQAEDYPVDLYYLMDLSASMADDKKMLSSLGDALAKKMNNLTSNFRLGFGSFVDKREMPFVSTVPAKLEKPCDNPVTGEPCAPPYGFINHMPLSSNTPQFKDEVMKAKVSGNLDSPEGGLDALMQVMVCHKEIGWREKARRLVVLSTDAAFHLAGDGKLAGVVEPNDGECHLVDNEYTHGEIMDYPSISQINVKAHENNIIIIFAVNDRQNDVYKKLAERINSATAAIMKKDSSNVVNLISQQYSKLVKAVTLGDDAPSHVEIEYFSSCLNESSYEHQTKECGGLRVGNKVNFTANIKALWCPEGSSNHLNFTIKPQGLGETVEVELEIICNCDCENPEDDQYKVNSSSCSNSGVLKCGVCDCNEDKVGNQCQCDRDSITGRKEEDLSGCVPGGNSSNAGGVICSNMGTCKCGVCDCFKRENPDEKITGKYCECDNYSCLRGGGKVCSGPDHGTCKCGKCQCNTEWKGSACECRNSNETCIKSGSSSGSNQVCSGHGVCECGQCHCDVTGDIRYSGKYCEECPTCTGLCKELGDCVECQVFGSSSTTTALSVEECNKCPFKPEIVEVLSTDESPDKKDESSERNEIDKEDEDTGEVKRCSLPDHADCTFFFEYRYDKEKNVLVTAKKKKQCSTPVNVLGVVLGVIGSIVLAGVILLLVWKLLTTVHDRREFIRFENERKNAKWVPGENPLYHPSTTNFANPTFGK